MKNIKDAGERAATLTKQLLAFSRQQVMEVKLTDVNVIVSDIEKMLRRLAGEDVELTTNLGPDLPNVKIDPGQMGQVIINLAVNARDAMPDGGRFTIETLEVGCEGDGSDSCHEGVPEGRYVLLQATDTGTGVDPEVQPHIFEPYFTTKEMGKGTGLGLSMVYGIISQSKGHIFVDSTMGQGTTFYIYLPAITKTTLKDDVGTTKRTDPLAGTETVLLVEDEGSVRAVAGEILQANGYTVIEAPDGPEALQEFEDHEVDIDLLLTDVVMPKMKGPELADRLRKIKPQLKILFMSGYHEESLLRRQIGDRSSVLIQKPFTPRILARKVREVLDSKEGAHSREAAKTRK